MVDPRSGQVPTIAELVRQKLATGLTLRQLEERSGGAVPYQTFGKISKGEVKGWPKSREVIEGTAHALGVDPREVVLGYATQFQIDVAEDRSLLASMLPASTVDLTIEQAQAVANLIRVFTTSPAVAPPPAVQLSALDISAFTTAERRQVTDLVLELGERAKAARLDGLITLASVLTFLEAGLAAAIDQADGLGSR
ncbi:hypothetical protein [Jatrophihabitans sp.]|uniref:hypothetical protein n=1 Tax=Jatrophihabitans sp. TaxID=1932789 RepID=UPI002C83584B|nr:hypothetical protein [Jatrophihabitans sp.]